MSSRAPRSIAAGASPSARRLEHGAVATLLSLCVFAAYLPALRAGFVFDDHALFVGTTWVRGPLLDVWLGRSEAPDYLPLTWTTFWLEWRAWGDSPAPYHVLNVALHAVAAVLLWRTLRALRVPGAWFGAALFALHPVAVESVAWISERKNTLSAVFFLGSILAWSRGDREDGSSDRAWSAARTWSLVLFAAATLSKASVVMLPFVLAAMLVHRNGTLRWKDARAVAPFFAVAAVIAFLTVELQHSRAIGEASLPARGLAERIGGAAWAWSSYARTALFPAGISFVYPDWPVPASSPAFYVPLAVVLAVAATLWHLRGRPWARAIGLGMGFHALLVFPVLGLVDMSYLRIGPVSNHLQYLALIGPAALGGYAASRIADRTPKKLWIAGAVGVAILLGSSSWIRASTFEDDLVLWQTAVAESPGNAFAHKQLAATLAAAGRGAEALDEIEAFARTTRDDAERHRARSMRLSYLGRFDEAVAEANEAERIRPDPEFRRDLARRLITVGRPDAAAAMLEPLVRAAPENLEYRYWLDVAREAAAGSGAGPR